MELSNWGLGASGLALLIGLLAQEFIKSLVTKFFANQSKTEINIILVLVIGLFTIGAFPLGALIENKTEKVANVEVEEQEQPLSKEEAYLEGGKYIIEKGEELASKKRQRDSIREADKEQKWVYQIGPIYSEKDELFNKYRILRDIGNVYVFKASRNDYMIILDDGINSESELNNSIDKIKEEISLVEKNVSVINLMDNCTWKEKLKKTNNITKRRENIEIPCWECDK